MLSNRIETQGKGENLRTMWYKVRVMEKADTKITRYDSDGENLNNMHYKVRVKTKL